MALRTAIGFGQVAGLSSLIHAVTCNARVPPSLISVLVKAVIGPDANGGHTDLSDAVALQAKVTKTTCVSSLYKQHLHLPFDLPEDRGYSSSDSFATAAVSPSNNLYTL